MRDESPILSELIQILKNNKGRDQAVSSLLNKYTQDREILYGLKQFLKAWNIEFEGSNDVGEIIPRKHPSFSLESFGRHMNYKIHPKVYALCNLIYLFERTGLPEDHAIKLSVIFKDEKKLLEYLQAFVQSFQFSSTPLHDACLFSLPDFKAAGFLDEKRGCRFELFQEMAVRGRGSQIMLLRPEFKRLLPFSWEIQKHVVLAKQSPLNFEHIIEKSKSSQALILDEDDDEIPFLAETYKKFPIIEYSPPVNDEKSITDYQMKFTQNMITNKTELLKVLFKRYESFESKKGELDGEEEEEYHILSKVISFELCILAELCSKKMLKDLTLLELSAINELIKIESNESYKIFIDNGIPSKFYAIFSALDRTKAGTNIPDIRINGAEIRHPGFYLMKVPIDDELQAARAACFGKMTACCQSLSGELGQPCVIHGLTSPNGGFYVVCQGDVNNPKVTDPVIGQSWTWRSQSDAIVFDSVEKRRSNNQEYDLAEKDLVIDFFMHLAEKLVREYSVTKVACGAESGISAYIGVNSILNSYEKYKDYDEYSDSSRQRVLLDIRRPYVSYNLNAYAAQLTQKLIYDIFNQVKKLSENEHFITLLNEVLIQLNNKDIIKLIKNTAIQTNRTDELDHIISDVKSFIDLTYMRQKENVLNRLASNPYYLNLKNEHQNSILEVAVENKLHDLCFKIFNMHPDLIESVTLPLEFVRELLLKAIATKNNNLVLKLIGFGADVNLVYHKEMTLLMLAAQQGNYELCDALINAKANPHAENSQGTNALMLSAAAGYTDICQLLIHAKVNLNAANKNGETALIKAYNTNHFDTCFFLIDQGANPEPFENELLIMAIQNGRPKTYLKLMKESLAHDKQLNGKTALMAAYEKADLDLCFMLIELGAIPKGDMAKTLFLKSAQMGRKNTSLTLIKSVLNLNDLEVANSDITFLIHDVLINDFNTFVKLIDAGARVDMSNSELQLAIIKASQKGDGDFCLKLVNLGVNIDFADSEGKTALIYAASAGHANTCVKLISAGAKVSAKDIKGQTALMHAAISQHLETFWKLIELGANINDADNKRKSILCYGLEKLPAKDCLTLIQKGADIHFKDNVGRTALMTAAAIPNKDKLLILINEGANVNEKDVYGNSALSIAYNHRHFEQCFLLIDYGGIPETKYASELLIRAAQMKRDDIVFKLIQLGADINATNKEGMSALSWAQSNGDVDACIALIELGAKPDPDFIHRELIKAASKGQMNVCLKLIQVGADVNYADNKEEETALKFAFENDHIAICFALIEKGAIPTENLGTNLLFKAIEMRHNDICLTLMQNLHSVDVRNSQGMTALIAASKRGSSDLCSKLIEVGAKVNAQDNQGRTALMWASLTNNVNTCEILILAGADIEAKNKQGKTALMLAIELGNSESCELLLKHGAICTDEMIKEMKTFNNQSLNRTIDERLENMTEVSRVSPILSAYSKESSEIKTNTIKDAGPSQKDTFTRKRS